MDIAILQFFEFIRNDVYNFIFIAFTFLAEENFIVFAICMIYWGISKKKGEFLLINVLSSVTVNGIIKDSVKRLRPFVKGDCDYVKVKNLFIDTKALDASYSFPSGHAQLSSSFFSSLALMIKKSWFYIISAFIILGVMLSRVYLGVHYPSDVIAGGVLGLIITFFWYFIYKKAYDDRFLIFIIITLILSLSLFFIHSQDSFKAAGSMLGASIGLFLENKYINFEILKSIPKKITRIAVGISIVLFLRILLKVIFPVGMMFDFIRYFILIFTATFLYPAVFKKLNF